MSETPPPAPSPQAKSAAANSSEVAQTLTIAVPVSSSSGGGSGGVDGGEMPATFSQLLEGSMPSPAAGSSSSSTMITVPVVAVPCFVAPAGLLDSPGITGKFAMTHQAVLATVTAQAQMQLQAGHSSTSSTPLTQPVLSSINPVSIQQSSPLKSEDSVSEDKVTPAGPGQTPASEQKHQSIQIVYKTTPSDGYNWRKYGQKQVKSSESSRSYYKCTHANCVAKKKVECCPDGRVTELVYRGDHNHEPPQKAKLSKERRTLPQVVTASKDDGNLPSPTIELANSDDHQLKIDGNSKNETAEQLHCSSDCEGDTGIKAEHTGDEPEPKRRNCESPLASSAPSLKTFKETKVVVQAPNDDGSASDGYRWRKYGQKIVKGNPNPRSYYKCTHMGCPVRKHVERASGGAKAVIITYEGKHNHDLPPPRIVNGTPTSAFPTADAAITVAFYSSCKTPLAESKPQEDKEKTGEGAKETESGMKALEPKSASTTASYDNGPPSGEDKGGSNNSDAIQRPLFDGNLAAVPVHNS